MSRQQAPPPSGSRKISFNVSDQYDIQDVVGEGAYGVVWWVLFGKIQKADLGNDWLTLQLGAAQTFRAESSH